MTTVNPATKFTPEDLLKLEGGDGLFELVDGNLIEKSMSSLSGETAVIVSSRLFLFSTQHQLGKVYSESTFRCFPRKPEQVRRPDIAFITTAKLGDVSREGHIRIPPDLAIEIVSREDGVYELDEKIREYRDAGIALIWVFNPEQRIVRVYENGRFKAELEGDDEIRGEPVLPGFSAKVSEMLPAPAVNLLPPK